MRILGLGDYGDLGDMYARLQRAGHDVRMWIADPLYRDVYRGLIPQVDDWREALPWIRAAGRHGLVICETAHHGALQDELRRDGFCVIGGSAFGDRLENDRGFGQAMMRQVGMHTAPMKRFTNVHQAIAYVRSRPKRYVCKHNGHAHPSTRNHVGLMPDGSDVIALLQQAGQHQQDIDVVLMDHLDGVETGIGAYFDGKHFLGPVCLDWEHKRFFPGDQGELTGEMGTVVTYRGGGALFAETLARMEPLLRTHGYHGYINLNTIINEEGVWPLEFTCRFGYPGFAILDALHLHTGWEGILRLMCGADIEVVTRPGYAVGVVLTVPPFPYLLDPPPSRGMPIMVPPDLSADEQDHLHYGEVDFSRGAPVVAGASGYVLVATGHGLRVETARRQAYGLLERIRVPNARFRTDIGTRFSERDAARLRQLGYLPDDDLMSRVDA